MPAVTVIEALPHAAVTSVYALCSIIWCSGFQRPPITWPFPGVPYSSDPHPPVGHISLSCHISIALWRGTQSKWIQCMAMVHTLSIVWGRAVTGQRAISDSPDVRAAPRFYVRLTLQPSTQHVEVELSLEALNTDRI